MSYGFFNLLVRIVCFLIFEISNCSSKIFDNSYALRLVSSSICIHGIVLQLLTIVPCPLTVVVSKSAFGVSTDDSLVKFTQKKHLFHNLQPTNVLRACLFRNAQEKSFDYFLTIQMQFNFNISTMYIEFQLSALFGIS